jgi:hypothetical protein
MREYYKNVRMVRGVRNVKNDRGMKEATICK